MDDSTEKHCALTVDSDDDLLGSNSEIAVKLKQFYAAIQEEKLPDTILDLLEKLDEAEQESQDPNGKSITAHERKPSRF